MNRRTLLTLLTAVPFAGLAGAKAVAQQSRPAQIGLVSLHGPKLAALVGGIREELAKLGHVDGRSITIEAHFTDGDKQRARDVLKSFIDSGVDVIVPWTTPTVQLAKEATQKVPIVMIASDPLRAGLVQSLSRPGGNITGVSMSGPDLAGKRLELMREIIPGLGAIGFLGYAPSPGAAAFVRETKEAAGKIRMNLVVRLIDRVDRLDPALFAEFKSAGVEALIVQPFFTGHAEKVAELGLRARLPVISDYPAFAKAGALASLGVDLGKRVRRTAYFIDRILKGASPAELPVEQPTEFELVLNLRTAKALGLVVSPRLLTIAEEVIE